MNTKKISPVSLFVLSLLFVFVASCAKKDISTDVAVVVSLTQTAAALQSPAPAPTEPPAAAPVAQSGYQPFNIDECNALSNALSANIGFPATVTSSAPFEDFINKQNGLGCKISISETGEQVKDLSIFITPGISTLQSSGWVDDMNYGLGGAGVIGGGFRKGDTLCLTLFKMEESDPALCPGNEPVSDCWARLAPEQMIYTATFNCSTYIP
jgi:hypothetical protein